MKIPGFSEVSGEDVTDLSDLKFKILNADKITESFKGESVEEDDLNVETVADTGLSAGKEFAGPLTALIWLRDKDSLKMDTNKL